VLLSESDLDVNLSSEVYPEENTDVEDQPEEQEQQDQQIETIEPQVPQKPALNFKYNQRTKEAYERYKFPVPDTVDKAEQIFLEDADLSYGPITRRIIQVHRLRPEDPRDGVKKEWLYYVEEWTGYDFLGNELPKVSGHIEGMYKEVIIKYGVDKKGRPVRSEPKFSRTQDTFYIPWSKSNLDKILKSTNTNPNTVKYYVHFGYTHAIQDSEQRDNTFTYEQISNSDWSDIIALEYRAGGPRAAAATTQPTTTTTTKKK